jgi:hypothetical protein
MYSLASYYQRFGEKYYVRLQDINVYFEDERQYILLKGYYSYHSGVTQETTREPLLPKTLSIIIQFTLIENTRGKATSLRKHHSIKMVKNFRCVKEPDGS